MNTSKAYKPSHGGYPDAAKLRPAPKAGDRYYAVAWGKTPVYCQCRMVSDSTEMRPIQESSCAAVLVWPDFFSANEYRQRREDDARLGGDPDGGDYFVTLVTLR